MDILGQSFNKFEYQSSSSSLLPNINEEEVSILLASARPKKPAGRRIFKETRHPVYRGVRMKKNNKWVCEVRVPNKSTRIWLGTYPTPEMAARAHDVAALTLKGKSACLNFSDSVWRLPLPASTNADEIRRVAAEAANAFADEDKDSYDQKLSSLNAVTDYEVCNSHNSNSFGVGIMEDTNKGNNKPLQQGLHVDVDEVAAGVSAFDDDTQDWVRSMADEPLRSPLPFAVRYDHREWNDVDVDVDAEVSLWNFTI